MEIPVYRLEGDLPCFVHFFREDAFHLHTHDHFEIMVVLVPGGEHRVGDRRFTMRRGDVFLLGPHHDHRFRHPSGAAKEKGAKHVNVAFLPEAASGASVLRDDEWAVLQPYLIHDAPMPVRLPPTDLDAVVATAEALVEIQNAGGPWRERLALATFQRLFYLVARRVPPSARPVDPLVLATLRRIAAGFRDEVTTTALAAACGLGVSRLAQRFRAATGETIKEALTRRRLLEARRLLETTGLTVTEVMERSGFRDLSYFNRAFRAQAGRSPTAWREAVSR